MKIRVWIGNKCEINNYPPTKLSPYMDFGLPNTHFDMSFTFACLEEAVTQMVGWQSASCFVGGKLYAYVHLLTRMMIVLG